LFSVTGFTVFAFPVYAAIPAISTLPSTSVSFVSLDAPELSTPTPRSTMPSTVCVSVMFSPASVVLAFSPKAHPT
jgi:hypothetical protein